MQAAAVYSSSSMQAHKPVAGPSGRHSRIQRGQGPQKQHSHTGGACALHTTLEAAGPNRLDPCSGEDSSARLLLQALHRSAAYHSTLMQERRSVRKSSGQKQLAQAIASSEGRALTVACH